MPVEQLIAQPRAGAVTQVSLRAKCKQCQALRRRFDVMARNITRYRLQTLLIVIFSGL